MEKGCGMYAWAGNRKKPGGLYRIRATGNAAYLPKQLKATQQQIIITFTDPPYRSSAQQTSNWTIEAWDLKRTKKYGSNHYNQRELSVQNASVSADGKTVTLTIPDLSPTWGMSIHTTLKDKQGKPFTRLIHNTIHSLPK